MDYIMLFIATLLLATDFSILKVYQKTNGSSPAASLGYSSLAGLFSAIIFFAINGFTVYFSAYSFIMAAFINAFSVCYSMLAFKLLKMGTVALYTLVLMCGGMIVPYVFGLVFLNEPFSVLKTIGLAVIFAGVVLANISKEKIGKKQIIICTAVFFLNGLVSVFSKLHQSVGNFDRVNSTEFVLIGGIFKFIFAGILFLLVKNNNDTGNTRNSILPWILIISSAVVGGLSYMLQLHGAKNLPATVLYPFITGGSIVATSVCSVVFFKEKLSKNLVISIILCFLGTLMFL